jgi:hypothetical protein
MLLWSSARTRSTRGGGNTVSDDSIDPNDCECHGTGEIVVESCEVYPYEGLPYRAVTRVVEKCPVHTIAVVATH